MSIHVPNVSPSQDVRPCVPHAPAPKVSVCPTQLCPQDVHPCALRVPCHPVPRMPSTCPRVPVPKMSFYGSHTALSPRCLCVPVPKMPIGVHTALSPGCHPVSPVSLSPRHPSMCPTCPCPQDIHPCVPRVPVPKMSLYGSHTALSPRCPCVLCVPVPKVSLSGSQYCLVPKVSMCPCPQDVHPCPQCVPIPRRPSVCPACSCPQGVRVSHTALSPRCPSMCPTCPMSSCPQDAIHVSPCPTPRCPFMGPTQLCPQGVCVSLSPGRPSMCPPCPCPHDAHVSHVILSQDVHVSHTALSPRCPCVLCVPVPKVSLYGSQYCLVPKVSVCPCPQDVHPCPQCVPIPETSVRVSHMLLSPGCPCVPHSFVPKVSIHVPYVSHVILSPGCHPCVPVSLSPRCPFMGPTLPCPQGVCVSPSPRCP
ncbi:vegetative cell wall protein gp1-like isoform X2 [Meleagris gallopavo]|uniref:vegetative cell wall protein gp1-like isoform X2 n=1 Tax=Meleagris gallopavo TaxID=9103 RepID=UPI00093DC9AE|nr:vegetative cell wall protein gp1-like isoform X2 [Meleagris gallopavo]